MTSNTCHGLYKLNKYKFCVVRFIRIGQKLRLAQKLLVRVKLTGNPYSYRTRINVNGRHWNTCKLVFLGTRILVLGLTLVSMWRHP